MTRQTPHSQIKTVSHRFGARILASPRAPHASRLDARSTRRRRLNSSTDRVSETRLRAFAATSAPRPRARAPRARMSLRRPFSARSSARGRGARRAIDRAVRRRARTVGERTRPLASARAGAREPRRWRERVCGRVRRDVTHGTTRARKCTFTWRTFSRAGILVWVIMPFNRGFRDVFFVLSNVIAAVSDNASQARVEDAEGFVRAMCAMNNGVVFQ